MKSTPKKTIIETIDPGHRIELLPEQEGYFQKACAQVHGREVNAAVNLKQLATVETAPLPVASTPAVGCADASPAVSGEKVTPVSHDPVLKKDQGGGKTVHSRAQLEEQEPA
jgi:hypothetical protein